jgi:hypothetical protein
VAVRDWSIEAMQVDERSSSDLPRDRGKSIGGDFDVDDEDSEQNFQHL